MNYTLTPEAAADLLEIVEHIAANNHIAAKAVLSEIRTALEQLSETPRIGHSRLDLTNKPVLFWPVRSYLIIYNPNSMPLQVIRVLSSYRDLISVL